MGVEPPVVPPEVTARAAVAVRWARALRAIAAVLRHQAATFKFHPPTGARPVPGPAVVEALQHLEHVLGEIQRAPAPVPATDADLAAAGDGARRDLEATRQAITRGVQLTAAALQVLQAVLESPNGATLDAPYGEGAPRRHHPGALCTMVAQRAEDVAAALETGAVLAANLALPPR